MASTKPKSAARCVDPLSHSSINAEIYVDDDGLVWNAMLNFTDITYGSLGNNKFYSVQLINDRGSYKVFRKWGRVGAASPQSSIEAFGGSLDRAMAAFKKRFAEKSGNRWPLTSPFEKKKGKYVYVELADDDEDDDGGDEKDVDMDAVVPPCSLPDQVQDLLSLICDTNLIAQEVSALNFDLKRMPLGRLSKAQISQGYTLLQQLSDALIAIEEIQNPQASAPAPLPSSTPAAAVPAPPTGRASRRRASAAATPASAAAAASTPAQAPKKKKMSKADTTRLAQLKADLKTLTSEFYSLIPHDFGRSLPPTIDSLDTVKNKIDLLQVLADLEISQQLQKDEKKKTAGRSAVNPLDAQYSMINTDMEPLDEKSEEFQRLSRFLENTQAPSQASYKLKIHSILKIARPPEQEKRSFFEDTDNHRLLWHGSRLSNVVGILSQGLRIAPPEAPKNGYNFGKGIYFADSVTKSACYCCTARDRPRAVLFVAEVALGKSYEAPHPVYLGYKDVNAHGCMSTKGVGQLAPKEEMFEQMEDGVVVPSGQIESKQVNGSMLFNEFIVYKQEQVRLRYLITTDFDYSSRHTCYN